MSRLCKLAACVFSLYVVGVTCIDRSSASPLPSNTHFEAGVRLMNSRQYVEAIQEFAASEGEYGYDGSTSRYKIYCLHQLNLMPEAANEAREAIQRGVTDHYHINGKWLACILFSPS